MRLTLRTLLSYLDDTLEPAQAKVIGQKVAESEQARELIERIAQVTRRRRLTTPPTTGPGGLDPNTMAEYLDNEVSPEQAAEVEQVCLASDVHLAEVAACHQILTLVLGEPALVPPSAKQRMYGLVKGPEAIPFRKPSRADASLNQDLSTELSGDADETLRLGLPWLRGSRNQLLLIGGGVAAAGLLVLALLQLLSPSTPNGGQAPVIQVAVHDDKDKEKAKPTVVEEAPTPKGEGAAPGKTAAEVKKNEEKKVEEIKVPPMPEEKPVTKEEPSFPAFVAPDPREVQMGRLVAAGAKEVPLLFQFSKEKADWKRVGGTKTDVFSGRPLVALPGSRAHVQLNDGVRLTLWGNLLEITGAPVYESMVVLYPQDKLNADLLLQRGRIILTNANGDRPTLVRVRFEDPRQKERQNHCDITLLTKDARVLVERLSELAEPFYDKPDHPNRVGPTVLLNCAVLEGSASLKLGDVQYTLSPPPAAYLLSWNSREGIKDPQPGPSLPEVFKDDPALVVPKEFEKFRTDAEKSRTGMQKAVAELAKNLEGKNLDVALAETLQGTDPAARILAIRCYGAVDDVGSILNRYEQENVPLDVMMACRNTLLSWVGQRRDNAYMLLDQLKKRYTKGGVAQKIVDLLHYPAPERLQDPLFYETLIDDLSNPLLPIRDLSAYTLYNRLGQVLQAGAKISYNPTASRLAWESAQQEWFRVVPRGQLPRPPQPGAAPPGKKN